MTSCCWLNCNQMTSLPFDWEESNSLKKCLLVCLMVSILKQLLETNLQTEMWKTFVQTLPAIFLHAQPGSGQMTRNHKPCQFVLDYTYLLLGEFVTLLARWLLFFGFIFFYLFNSTRRIVNISEISESYTPSVSSLAIGFRELC
ncbi:hypothetical protein T01_5933 [Trichinella spiralis]|uniref:Uncharacterized protein n=1 Tax=Trichinella spiralis TaxID=6334 RepID=A0A0V1APD7_TRISP|nr:hypothetical protein T01_4374 [Trichinella spiralis]KRY29694.1 hypothetical protein T01_5933 [Trichinella spiralis]